MILRKHSLGVPKIVNDRTIIIACAAVLISIMQMLICIITAIAVNYVDDTATRLSIAFTAIVIAAYLFLVALGVIYSINFFRK